LSEQLSPRLQALAHNTSHGKVVIDGTVYAQASHMNRVELLTRLIGQLELELADAKRKAGAL
jgi:hypothetical protein